MRNIMRATMRSTVMKTIVFRESIYEKKAHDPNYSLSKRRQHVHDDNMFATNDSQDSMVNWLPHQGTDAQHRAKV